MAILAIGASKEIVRIPLGPYVGILLGDVESVGLIRYGNVLDVVDERTGQRALAVAAERNELAGTSLGGGSHFVCVYERGTHVNHGASNDYNDRDKFLAKALELAREYLSQAPASQTSAPDSTKPFGARSNSAGTTPPVSQPWKKSSAPASAPVESSSVPQRVSTPYRHTDSEGTKWSLIGAGLFAFGLVIVLAPNLMILGMLSSLLVFVWPAAYFSFLLGCIRTETPKTGSAGTWLRAAKIFAGSALAVAAGQFIMASVMAEGELAMLLSRISAHGLFLLALGCHAGYLRRLSASLGLSPQPQLSLALLGLLSLLAIARLAGPWLGLGQWYHKILVGSLVGVGLWLALQISLSKKAIPPTD